MKVAIHQPNFAPWMGYFYKMARCSSFYYFDNAEYTKSSFIRRVLIHKGSMGELAYIRVPLINHSDYAKINQLQIVQSTKWQQRIVAQIHQAYHKAPYYQQLEELISKFFIEEPESYNLSDYNIAIIEYIRKLLNIDISTNLVSRLNIQSKKTDAVLDIIKSANGTEYISGNGAKKYHDAEKFEIYNIQLNYPDFPSYFDKLMIPNHFKYASILSYLAHYSIDEIRGFLA